MYRRSSSIQRSKVILFLPLICHKQVKPGLTLKRRISHASENRETSLAGSARGPTSDIDLHQGREQSHGDYGADNIQHSLDYLGVIVPQHWQSDERLHVIAI